MEIQRGLKESIDFLKRMNLSDLKTAIEYILSTVSNTVKYWPKDKQTDQWNRVQKQTKTVTDFWQRYQGNLIQGWGG